MRGEPVAIPTSDWLGFEDVLDKIGIHVGSHVEKFQEEVMEKNAQIIAARAVSLLHESAQNQDIVVEQPISGVT